MRNIYINIVYILLLASLSITNFAYGQVNDTTIYSTPDVYPEFKYLDFKTTGKACEKYFKLNYKMPLTLIDNGYKGAIIVRLIIEKDGKLSNIKIIRGMNDSLDESILNFIKTMPVWTPGLKGGKFIRTEVNIPIRVSWLYGNNE